MEKEKVAIVWIGRVGLPLALLMADLGFHVYGVDSGPDYVELLKKGKY